jgi:hypothetical protein
MLETLQKRYDLRPRGPRRPTDAHKSEVENEKAAPEQAAFKWS